MSEPKRYVGKGREFGNYGNVKISFKLADVQANEKGYVNLIIGNMRETDKYGNTKTVWIDDFVPQQRQQNTTKEEYIPTGSMPEKDLPF